MGRKRRCYIVAPYALKPTRTQMQDVERAKSIITDELGYTCVPTYSTFAVWASAKGVLSKDYKGSPYYRLKWRDAVMDVVRTCKAFFFIDGWEKCEMCRIIYQYADKENLEIFFDQYECDEPVMTRMEQAFGVSLRGRTRTLAEGDFKKCYVRYRHRFQGVYSSVIARDMECTIKTVQYYTTAWNNNIATNKRLRQAAERTGRLLGVDLLDETGTNFGRKKEEG